MTPKTPKALAALIDWYVESGVDLALDETPHDRYAESARAPAPREPIVETRETAPQRERSAPPTPAAPDEAARAAQRSAAAARDLDDLRARFEGFEHAPFRSMAQHFLLSAGTPGAPVMALDVAPGETEERSGEAFSGPHARLLDNMFAAIGHDRARAYLAYLSPWRPPGDKTASALEAAILAPFARRHVELARPDILLLFGETPARVMLETSEPFSRLRGKWRDCRCGGHVTRAMVFSSLDAMLKSAALKPAAWRDLRAVAEALQAYSAA